MTPKPRVLFLCTHNAARSQMAEAILRRAAGDRFEVLSCGIEPTDVHPLTKTVLEERGLPTADLRAKPMGEFLGKVDVRYAVIVCEQTEDICPRIFPFTLRTLQWPFDDPARVTGGEELQLAAFRRVRDQIDQRIQSWLSSVPG